MNKQAFNLLQSRKIHIWHYGTLILSFMLPFLTVFLRSQNIFFNFQWESQNIHIAVETIGVFSACIVAFSLLYQEDKKYFPLFFSASLGFLAMGIMDGFHLAVPLGQRFVFYHSVGSILGGFFFCSSFLFRENMKRKTSVLIFTITAITVLSTGIFYLIFPSFLPEMVNVYGQFTPLTKKINMFSSLFFFLASIRFMIAFHKSKMREFLLTACLLAVFCSSGTTFEFSRIWDDVWWFWHLLRTSGYIAIFSVVLLRYREIEKKIKENEKRLRYITETIEEVFWITSPDMKEILYISPSYRDIWERYQSDLIGDPDSFFDFIVPEDIDRVKKKFDEPFKDKWKLEYRIERPSGEIRWIRDKRFAVYNEDNEIVAITGITSDITDYKKSEEAVVLSARLLNNIINLLPYRIFWKNKDSVYMGSNISFARDVGINSTEDIVGKKDSDFKKVKLALEHAMDDQEVIAGKVKKLRYEEVQTNEKGEKVFIEKSKVPLTNEKGEVTGVLVTYTDITEKKVLADQLKRSEERLMFAMEAIDEGIWDFYPQEKKLHVSARWYTMLGYDPYEFPEKYETWKNLLHPEDADNAENMFKEFFNNKQTNFEVEARMRTKDGKWKWILSRAKVVERDEAGFVKRMVGTHSDVTKRKTAEQEKEKALEAKSQFTSMVSHELRTPLTAIKGGVDLVLDGFVGEINEEQKDLLGTVQRNVDRLKRIVNEILDFQKFDSGKILFNFKKNSIVEIIEEVLLGMNLAIEEKK